MTPLMVYNLRLLDCHGFETIYFPSLVAFSIYPSSSFVTIHITGNDNVLTRQPLWVRAVVPKNTPHLLKYSDTAILLMGY